MKFAGSPGRFEAEQAHDFEGAFPQGGAIGGKQNIRVTLGDFNGREKQILEIIFDLERFSPMRPRESWWIENYGVEFLSFPCQSRQHYQHVIRDETVIGGRERVERK